MGGSARQNNWVALLAALLAAGNLCASCAAKAQEEPPELAAEFDRHQTYYLHLPVGYTPKTEWPLFIVVHGTYASGIGDFKLWRPYADQEGFILLAPNFTGDYDAFARGEDTKLRRLIAEVDRKYRLDLKHILLSGFSRGGVFACRFVFQHPDLIHTAVIFNLAPYAPPIRRRVDPPRTRFYLAAGTAEEDVAKRTQQFAKALQANGYQVEVCFARGVGHSIPSGAIPAVIELVRAMKAERLGAGAGRTR